jgi:hypothetical protein
MPWYRDPRVIVPAVISLLALLTTIALAIYTNRRQFREKTVDYEVVAQLRLLGSAQIPANLAAVTVSGTVAKDPYLSLVRIRNTGRKPVAATDFASDLTISLQSAPVAAAVVGDASAQRLRALTPIVADRAVTVPAMFLNASDWVEIAIVSEGNPTDVNVDILITEASRPPKRVYSAERSEVLKSVASRATDLAAVVTGIAGVVTAIAAFLAGR